MATTTRRGPRGFLLPAWFAACVALALPGCGNETAPRPPGGETPLVTDTDYVEYVAALTVVLEEQLSGDPAAVRMDELGAPRLTRARVESFAVSLRSEPERWLRLTKRVDERVGEIREEIESTRP